jgi:hypothetical protein
MGKSPTTEQIREEQRRLRHLRVLVDLTSNVIMQSRPSRAQAEQLVEAMRRRILQLFPGKDETYDIIYRPRFERLIGEFATGAEILPFRRSEHSSDGTSSSVQT